MVDLSVLWLVIARGMLHPVAQPEQEDASALSHSRQRTAGLVLADLVCTIADHLRGIGDDRPVGIAAGSGRSVWSAAEDRPPGLALLARDSSARLPEARDALEET